MRADAPEAADHVDAIYERNHMTQTTSRTRSRPKRQQGVLLTAVAISIAAAAYSLTHPLGRLNNPGPGLWPTIGALLMVGSSVTLFVREKHSKDYEAFSLSTLSVVAGMGLIVGFATVLPATGLVLPLAILMILWIKFLGRESWMIALMVGVVGALVIYIVFDVLLGIPFPRGTMFSWIGR